MIKLIADTHTHTLASTHAYSTITENARSAFHAGLSYLGWTDHAPSMTDAPHRWHFENLQAVPEMLFDVHILKGAEVDIISPDGDLDLEERVLASLDWAVASIHRPLLDPNIASDFTEAYLTAAKNPHIDVIGHSGLAAFPYDYEKAVKAFRDLGKLVEINEGSFLSRPTSVKNCVKIAQFCKQHECRIIVNSDAHFYTQIGHCDNALSMLEEIGFPEELVVNAGLSQFEAYLSERKRRVSGK